MERSELLALPVFDGIRAENLPKMLDCLGCYEKHYRKNEMIMLEEETVRRIGVVLSGTVHMIKEDIDGGKSLMMTIRPGELFGESFACASQLSARVSFVAAAPCAVLFLPFHKVIHSCTLACTFHHRLIENMLRLLSEKNQRLMDKVAIISQRTLRDKILAYLRTEADYQQCRRFTIPLGRVELSEYLGVNRSALTRELAQMREEGLIDFEKNTFILR